MKKLLIIIGLCLTILSCKRQPLTYDYYPYCDIDFSINWRNLTNCGEDVPNGVSVIFYPTTEKGEYELFQKHSVTDFTVSVREGVYNVLVFNQIPSDFGTLVFKGMDYFSTAVVEAKPRSLDWYTLQYGETGVTRKPEYLAVATLYEYEVTADMVSASVRSRSTKSIDYLPPQISIKPKVVVSTTNVNVKVNGVHNIRTVRGSISNFSLGYSFSKQKTLDATTVHLLEEWSIYKDAGSYYQGGITTQFTTFGLPSDNISTRSNSDWFGVLRLQFDLVDGDTTVEASYKVDSDIKSEDGDQLLNMDLGFTQEEGDEEVYIEDVEPEDNPGDGGGFDAEVDDWGEQENVVVPMI